MRWALVLIASRAMAAPPAQTRDVAKLALPPVPTKGLCMIERTLTSAGAARMQLVYTSEGRLLRREWWTLDGEPAQEGWVAYSWDKSVLTQAADKADLVTSYRYADGRLVRVESPGRAIDLAWTVTPVAKPQRMVVPTLATERAPVPLHGAFSGTVAVTTTEGDTKSSVTYTYDPHGVLQLAGCTTDAKGRATACGDTRFKWSGDQLIETTTPTTRETYTYDGAGRMTARARLAKQGSAFVVAERTRYEYRCEGAWIDDPLWP